MQGKALIFLEPTEQIEGGIQKAWTLKANEYVRLLDSITGKIVVHRGEIFTKKRDIFEGKFICLSIRTMSEIF